MEVGVPNIKIRCETLELKTGFKTTNEQAKRFALEKEETLCESQKMFEKIFSAKVATYEHNLGLQVF